MDVAEAHDLGEFDLQAALRRLTQRGFSSSSSP
jgi:hypothetical protein